MRWRLWRRIFWRQRALPDPLGREGYARGPQAAQLGSAAAARPVILSAAVAVILAWWLKPAPCPVATLSLTRRVAPDAGYSRPKRNKPPSRGAGDDGSFLRGAG